MLPIVNIFFYFHATSGNPYVLALSIKFATAFDSRHDDRESEEFKNQSNIMAQQVLSILFHFLSSNAVSKRKIIYLYLTRFHYTLMLGNL